MEILNNPIRIIFRCDASNLIGYGHLIRCLSLAKEVFKNYKWEVIFYVEASDHAKKIISDNGFKIFSCPSYFTQSEEENHLLHFLTLSKPSFCFFDIRKDYSSDFMNRLSKMNILTVTIDDPCDKRLYCDMAFYPPVPQLESMSWNNSQVELFVGWEWVVIKNEINEIRLKKLQDFKNNKKTSSFKITILCGASDPKGISLIAIDILEMIDLTFDINLVIGPDFYFMHELRSKIANCKKKVNLVENNFDQVNILSKTDLSFVSFGVTAYEIAASGIPSILVGISEDHAKSASIFEKNNMALNLGYYLHLNKLNASKKIYNLITDSKTLESMQKACFKNIDTNGVVRILEQISRRIPLSNEK